MNQRVRSGLLLLGISLALVGAVVSAHEIPAGAGSSLIASEEVVTVAPDRAQTQVPLRSGLLKDQDVARDPSASPVAVRIADIGLEASILPVGVDAQNRFAVPTAQLVGWYEHSAAPGSSTGSTVLAAHVDYGGQRGAFFDLEAIEVGETLEVEMANGTLLRYRVIDNVLYQKDGLPAQDLFRKDGDSVLQLITCGGTFDSDSRSYQGNVVVTAIPLENA